LGYFNDEDDAARKYDKAAAPLKRPLNFPGEYHIKMRTEIDDDQTYLGRINCEEEAAYNCDQAAAPQGTSSNLRKQVDISGARNPAMVAAVIRINGKRTHLGYFESEEEAAQKYDEVALTLKETRGEDLPSFQMNAAKSERLNMKSVRSAGALSADGSPVVVRVGTQVRKVLKGFGVVNGTVVEILRHQAENEIFFRVRYEDGNIEDLTRAKVEGLILSAPFHILNHALLRTPPTANSRSKRKATVAALLDEGLAHSYKLQRQAEKGSLSTPKNTLL
jgi:hypothetical protein